MGENPWVKVESSRFKVQSSKFKVQGSRFRMIRSRILRACMTNEPDAYKGNAVLTPQGT
jgi:hypothetical protein